MNREYTFRNIDGYCPYLDTSHSIKCKYSIGKTLSQPIFLKFASCDCSYSDECSMSNECPLKEKAKQIKS